MLFDHLEGWGREGGRETQEGGDMGNDPSSPGSPRSYAPLRASSEGLRAQGGNKVQKGLIQAIAPGCLQPQ